ncbi:hypothetical protein [Novipirellula sp.]|uniref:hypothetical protein n=1 Tax=Novipirellula sp. TaxID=2795430 RepID=UPI00356B3E85
MKWIATILSLVAGVTIPAVAGDYNITDFGETAGDQYVDTTAIENYQCRKSILAGGVDGMIIRGNIVTGKIVGDVNQISLVRQLATDLPKRRESYD